MRNVDPTLIKQPVLKRPAASTRVGWYSIARGQVMVGPNLLAKGEECIFSLGDCASLLPEGSGWCRSAKTLKPGMETSGYEARDR